MNKKENIVVYQWPLGRIGHLSIDYLPGMNFNNLKSEKKSNLQNNELSNDKRGSFSSSATWISMGMW